MPDNGEELISNPDTPPKKLRVQDYQEDEQNEEWANFNDLRNSNLNFKKIKHLAQILSIWQDYLFTMPLGMLNSQRIFFVFFCFNSAH